MPILGRNLGGVRVLFCFFWEWTVEEADTMKGTVGVLADAGSREHHR